MKKKELKHEVSYLRSLLAAHSKGLQAAVAETNMWKAKHEAVCNVKDQLAKQAEQNRESITELEVFTISEDGDHKVTLKGKFVSYAFKEKVLLKSKLIS